MKPLEFLLLAFLLPSQLIAGSAMWNLNPTSNDWNTAANWTPEVVPDQSTDVATFDVSNVTNISIPDYLNLGGMTFNPGASAYTFSGIVFFNEPGIINNSSLTQSITAPNFGFFGSGTAGSNMLITIPAGESSLIAFLDRSNAGSATIVLSGTNLGQSAAEANFWLGASAAESTIINQSGDLSGATTTFHDDSFAGNSLITVESGALVEFDDSSHAENATLVADGGTIKFADHSYGGFAAVVLTNHGALSLDQPDMPGITIGSIEGDSTAVLRMYEPLTVGLGGRSTTFAGLISQAGSLTKVGIGTLTLSGANTYLGTTTIAGGTLLVQARIGSATSSNLVLVDGGTLGGKGTISGPVTVGRDTGRLSYLSPGTNGPDTLTISSAVTFKPHGIYRCDLSLGQAKADQINANGATIQNGAQFLLQPKGFQTLPLGTVFTVINNTAATPIGGKFRNLFDGAIINGTAGNRLQAGYTGGDGNDLTLTVVP